MKQSKFKVGEILQFNGQSFKVSSIERDGSTWFISLYDMKGGYADYIPEYKLASITGRLKPYQYHGVQIAACAILGSILLISIILLTVCYEIAQSY